MCNPVTTKHPEVLITKGLHLGYEYEVTSNMAGYRCGYVRLPAGHPWHGKDYDDDFQPEYPDVHGGLTFAQPDTDCGKGGDDNAWWLGFDCAHMGDAPDPSLPGGERSIPARFYHGDTIKGTEYVVSECVKLAEQAAAAVTS